MGYCLVPGYADLTAPAMSAGNARNGWKPDVSSPRFHNTAKRLTNLFVCVVMSEA